MTTESDLELQAEPPTYIPVQQARRWPWIVAAFVIAVGSAGAYVWQNPGSLMQIRGRGSDPDLSSGDKAMLTELMAGQQKSADDIERLSKAVADQQEELKAMADQLAAISTKLDALQQAEIPQPVLPPSTQSVLTPTLAAGPPPRASPKPRRPPSSELRDSGPISVGGAPLLPPKSNGAR